MVPWPGLPIIMKRKTKEIGIRKVAGATVYEIMSMLNKNFTTWILVSFVIACPIAYYAANKWLENFAYKTTLPGMRTVVPGTTSYLNLPGKY